MRIVIAEDESIIRMDLREMLIDNGMDVVGEARDGASAVKLVCDLKPDCALIDIRMNGPEDGLEAAQLICKDRLAPVVMLTAFSQSNLVERAAEIGAMAYVTKPFSEKTIIPAITIACSRFEEATALSDEISDLSERLAARKSIEKAKGILMRGGLTESEAFAQLRSMAMNHQKSLKETAESIIMVEEADIGFPL